nr:MAG TPA: hypothetical protein [Caudoviricetes sp.]DAQ06463.1 MAG TPA: hypothetical protein [Bacteriophage sp.]
MPRFLFVPFLPTHKAKITIFALQRCLTDGG